jgi:hypothetical protein
LYQSANGGVTFPLDVYAFGGDKEWMVIDKTGGIGSGNIYQAWSPAASCCGPNLFTRSVDGGLAFLQPIPIPSSPRWGTMTVGKDGAVYVAGVAGTSGYAPHVRSSNAQNPAVTPVFDLQRTVFMGGRSSAFAAGSPNPGGLEGQMWVVSDHSDNPSGGNVYMCASLAPLVGSDPKDVHLVRSTDRGQTWSAPVRINDDPVNNGAWQWFAAVAVAPNGRIDVVWNDTRNSGQSNLSEVYYSFSMDAGQTWSANIAVSPVFDSWVGWPNGQSKIGDYTHMLADNAGGSLAYAATFNGEQDVYFLRIPIDCNGDGFPDAEELALDPDADCNDNDIPDDCDVTIGMSSDCDGNVVPDECEEDSDADGLINACDPCPLDPGPTIKTHPAGADVCEGGSVQLKVMAAGTPVLTYQWRKDGFEIPGAGGPTFSISSAVLDDAGTYDVIVMNACGSAMSDAAVLSVTALATCDDANACTADSCSAGQCMNAVTSGAACDDGAPCTVNDVCDESALCAGTPVVVLYGDVDPPGGNGIVDVDDLTCLVYGYAEAAACPGADIHPCGGDDDIDVDDLLEIVRAYGGFFACPHPCPP